MTPADRRLVGWLFLTFACLYLLTSGGHFYASDDLQKLRLLDSLLREGDLTIDGGWVRGVNHARYSWFPLGASLVMLPGWAVGQLALHAFPMLPAEYVVRFFVSLQNAFVSAALVAVSFLYARFQGASKSGSAFAAMALGLGTMVWPYAKTAWSEPAAALVAFAGLFALQLGDRAVGRSQAAWWLAAGLMLADAAFIRQEMGLIAVGAAAWLAWRHRHDRPSLMVGVVALIAPLGLVGVVALWYNQVRYGHPLNFMNYRLPQQNLVMEEGRFGWSLKNVLQYTLSPNQGLAWFSPAVALGLAGWKRLPKETAWLFIAALAPLALFYVYGWGLSSWAWGLRYTYVFVPFLVLPAALLWDAAPRRRVWFAPVLALGVAVQLLGVLHDYNRLYEDELFAYRGTGFTITKLMTEPAHSPLWLAVKATPATIANGLELATAHGDPATSVREYQLRRRNVPDFWFVLQLLSPIPRILTALAALLLALALAVSAWGLARQLRENSGELPGEVGHERERLSNLTIKP